MTAITAEFDKQIRVDNGSPEVSASWVKEHRDDLKFIDVREPSELTGPLGQVEGVQNTPLLSLLGQAKLLDKDTPYVLICRSGRRSSLAAKELKALGFGHVASVEGGMMAWNLQVEGRSDIVETEREANTENLEQAISRLNGLPEVSARWVHANLGRFALIDVREPSELQMMGAVAQAENVPLSQFMQTAGEIDRSTPLVIMCASGGRSGRVTHALVGAGFKAVASMEGGIFGWKAAGLPTV
ncbi:MAG: rhodanese-like domain-containing protein [Myxococcota bacterium]|nr:rhodanese-like domain-containing protein [Myxococcota bacterium]